MYCCRIADHGPQARASWDYVRNQERKNTGVAAGQTRAEVEADGWIVDKDNGSFFSVHKWDANLNRVESNIISGNGQFTWGAGLKTANDLLGYADYGEAAAGAIQLGMIEYRQSLPIASKIGSFARFYATYKWVGGLGRAFGRVGHLGTAVNAYIDYNSMKSGEISKGRFAYRTTGAAASIAGSIAVGTGVGGPAGAMAGAGIGLGFTGAEQGYDGFMYWHTQISTWLTNFENGIKSGWVPGR